MLKTAVVILNWNGKAFLERFLPGVLACSESDDCKVFVADNGSEDGSVEFLKSAFPTVELVLLGANQGFTGGYNRALARIQADYFVLLNSDVEVTPGWIEPVVHVMEQDETIAAAVPKILSHAEPGSFEYAGAAGGFMDRWGYAFCRGRLFEVIEKDEGQYNDRRDIFWASGAAFFVRAALFHQVGGFDDRFFAHQEEIDLCWRLKNMGYRIVFEPGSRVYHVGGGSLPNEHPFKLYLNFRNNLFLLFKNLASEDLVPTLLVRWLFDLVAALKFLAAGHFRKFLAVPHAHLAFLRALPALVRQRRKLLRRFVGFHHAEIYPGSIVLAHFLKGVDRFDQLRSWRGGHSNLDLPENENPLC